jgi:hypothetical protein
MVATTFQPFLLKSSAVALPIPLDAPVINIVLVKLILPFSYYGKLYYFVSIGNNSAPHSKGIFCFNG